MTIYVNYDRIKYIIRIGGDYVSEQQDSKNEIGSILQSYRMKARYTQKQIGLMTGKAPQTVASWESGKAQPDIQTFITLCYIYGIVDIFKTFGNKNFLQFEDEQTTLLEVNEMYNYKNPGLTENEQDLVVNYRKLNEKSQKLVNNIVLSIIADSDPEDTEIDCE
ncbi:MAG: helix-turn-helix domain-containing protein [Oscillospiraceae bacterium]